MISITCSSPSKKRQVTVTISITCSSPTCRYRDIDTSKRLWRKGSEGTCSSGGRAGKVGFRV